MSRSFRLPNDHARSITVIILTLGFIHSALKIDPKITSTTTNRFTVCNKVKTVSLEEKLRTDALHLSSPKLNHTLHFIKAIGEQAMFFNDLVLLHAA